MELLVSTAVADLRQPGAFLAGDEMAEALSHRLFRLLAGEVVSSLRLFARCDPYRILVSEIMLQQTQVDRVLPKYHEWLEKYPYVELVDLNESPELRSPKTPLLAEIAEDIETGQV